MKQEKIIQEIKFLQSRNQKVEAEKSWETSWQRKTLVVSITYVFMVFFMNMVGVKGAFINAMIPTFGFFLSTLSLGFLRKKYIQKYLTNKQYYENSRNERHCKPVSK